MGNPIVYPGKLFSLSQYLLTGWILYLLFGFSLLIQSKKFFLRIRFLPCIELSFNDPAAMALSVILLPTSL